VLTLLINIIARRFISRGQRGQRGRRGQRGTGDTVMQIAAAQLGDPE
jgi:hypothetical protein